METVLTRERNLRIAERLLITVKILIPVILITAAFLFLSGRIILVSGSSMEPTFHSGQVLMLTDNMYGMTAGDIVIFKDPESDKELVKRIVGIPGDTVTVSENGIYINNVRIDDLNSENDAVRLETYTLSEGEFFVLGDNRGHSRDSRFFGPVGADSISAKVLKPLF